MSKFKVGDMVQVTDPGQQYSTYNEFFQFHNLPCEMAARYAYNGDVDNVRANSSGERYFKVLFVGQHENERDGNVVVIEMCAFPRTVYLVHENGLEVVKPKKMWKIPVTWRMYGFVKVEAPSLEEAFELAADPSVPLPNGDYIEDSFEVDEDDIESVRKVWNNGQEDAR